MDSGGSRTLIGGGGAPCPRDVRRGWEGGLFTGICEPRQLRGSVLVWMGRGRGGKYQCT